jgi:hypothetical protein
VLVGAAAVGEHDQDPIDRGQLEQAPDGSGRRDDRQPVSVGLQPVSGGQQGMQAA